MNSVYMKTALLHKLRFVQRYPYLASEVGAFSADVAAISNGKLFEYEIKTSMSDFRVDFNKPKHLLYQEIGKRTEKKADSWVPHQFYFAVTEEMADDVAAKLLSYPLYGLIVVKQVANQWKLREAPVVLKRARALHSFEISQGVYQQFLFRMGSELASLATHRLKGGHIEEPNEEADG